MVGTVLDIETTGFMSFVRDAEGNSVLSDESEILEVAYMNFDMNTRKLLTYGTLYFYKPYFHVESSAQEIHHITRDFLEQYEDKFNENLVALNAMLQSTCVIGKNCKAFDIPMIKAFIRKHAGDKMNIPDLVLRLNMSAYNGGRVIYNDPEYMIDLQSAFREEFRHLYYEKNGYLPTPQKRGSLDEYVDLIPNGREATEVVYNTYFKNKDRITGSHGALYDVAMTYVVYCYANNKQIV